MPIAVVNPTTGAIEEEFTAHTPAEVQDRLAKAQAAYQVLRRTPYDQRAAWMNKAADLMEADVDKLATMIVREMGKPITQARGEALKCVKNMRFYAGNAEAFLADEPLADPSSVNALSLIHI